MTTTAQESTATSGRTRPETAASSPDVDKGLDRLGELEDLIGAVNSDRDELYGERLQLFQELTAAGVPRAVIAEAAGITPGMVKFALAEAKKKKETRDG